jgi:hypothetical protein
MNTLFPRGSIAFHFLLTSGGKQEEERCRSENSRVKPAGIHTTSRHIDAYSRSTLGGSHAHAERQCDHYLIALSYVTTEISGKRKEIPFPLIAPGR